MCGAMCGGDVCGGAGDGVGRCGCGCGGVWGCVGVCVRKQLKIWLFMVSILGECNLWTVVWHGWLTCSAASAEAVWTRSGTYGCTDPKALLSAGSGAFGCCP